jgi:hypothetical protein
MNLPAARHGELQLAQIREFDLCVFGCGDFMYEFIPNWGRPPAIAS